MAISRARLAAVAAGAIALTAVAVSAQQRQDRPESLLPPGFGDAPAPTPTPSAAPRSVTVPSATATTGAAPALALPLPSPSVSPGASPTPVDPATLAQYEMPLFARRSLAVVGTAGPADGGVRPDAFGGADGHYLETLMRRLSAPLPSRWLSIALRRTLASRVATPARMNGADFAAERAWLLLRMGEANAARGVVQNVDNANYTAKLYQVAMQVALATGDPAALCPIADGGRARDWATAGWTMAQAMCAGLGNAPDTGRALFAAARRQRVAGGIDLQLAQKVLGAGSGRQAVTIEWDGVDRLNAWRFGLATATGVAIPETLYAGVGPQVTGWRALAPSIAAADRAGAAEAAAAMGVLSNLALVDLYGEIAEADDTPAPLAAVASDLTAAYVGADVPTRLAALKQLWDGGTGTQARYARLVLTARAAARIRPGDGAAEADRFVAAMLAAGLDRSAQRWRGTVASGGDAWAMLTLADPDLRGTIPYRDLAGYAGTGDSALKQRLLFAGLAGLGRLDATDIERAAEALDVKIGTRTPWTVAIDRAVRERQPATVVLLAATGMQTSAWNGVPPAMLYRIVASLRAVGMDGYARMIAAEAIARA